MKKLIFLFIAILFVAVASAQVTKTSALTTNQYVYSNDTDVSLTTSGDTVVNYVITLNKADDVFYDIKLNMDSVSGTPDYVVDVKGKIFSDDAAWVDLETDVNWVGTSADTTISFQEHSTAVFQRIIQVSVTGQAGTGAATSDKLQVKIWK